MVLMKGSVDEEGELFGVGESGIFIGCKEVWGAGEVGFFWGGKVGDF
jgi:hypothetical protein